MSAFNEFPESNPEQFQTINLDVFQHDSKADICLCNSCVSSAPNEWQAFWDENSEVKAEARLAQQYRSTYGALANNANAFSSAEESEHSSAHEVCGSASCTEALDSCFTNCKVCADTDSYAFAQGYGSNAPYWAPVESWWAISCLQDCCDYIQDSSKPLADHAVLEDQTMAED